MKKRLVAATAVCSVLMSSGIAFAGTGATYTVRNGDTLYKIAHRTGISLSALEAANPQVKDYNNIWPGMVIHLPVNAHQAKVNAIIATAKALLGVPYQWGGNSPSTGFDCSGFVQYVFAKNGIALPRESHDQASVGTFVPKSQLQAGDLVFFANTCSNRWPNGVTHVGIYLGNGNMIESSSTHNKGVTIVHNIWNSPYYTAHYWGAKRVIR